MCLLREWVAVGYTRQLQTVHHYSKISQFDTSVFLTLDILYCLTRSSVDYFMHMVSVIPLFYRAFGSSFTRRKQGLFLLVTYRRLLCHSLMNLICVCRLSGQCLTCGCGAI